MKARTNLIVGILLAVLTAVGFQAYKTAAPERWSYVIAAPKDEYLLESMEILGAAGYELISSRRASDGAEYKPKISYELILKRKGGPDILAIKQAYEVGQTGVKPSLLLK